MKQNKGWRPLGRLFASWILGWFLTDIVIVHIYTTDQGTEILNKELTAYLEANHTNHIVGSKDEHASIGAAENSIGVLRTSRDWRTA